MKTFQKRYKRNLIIAFTFSLAILIFSAVISYESVTELLDSQEWVDHTALVKSDLESLISTMKDAETGQRGYLLTGDETFLEPYTGSKEKVMGYFEHVRELTQDNKTQQNDFDKLDSLITQKFSVINQTISDRRKSILPAVPVLLKGKAIMDATRALIKVMIERENKLMILRTAKANRFASYTSISILAASLISVIISIAFYLKMVNDNNAVAELEKNLRDKKQQTEKQIDGISNVAQQIADGNYNVRIDPDKLK